MTSRLYVPATLAALAEHVASGAVPVTAQAVRAEDESEEAEYAALMAAADASADLLDGPGRRVVVVLEPTGPVPAPGAAVPMRDVVAVHVDTRDDADPDDDLAWYATQEIPGLLG